MAESKKSCVLASIYLFVLFLSVAPLSSAELPQSEIDALVELHNEGRSNVEPEASNMNRVSWSHELYAAAKDRVERCRYVVDIPRSTGHFGSIVQFTGISRRDDFDLEDAVDTWLGLGKDSYNFADNTCSRSSVFCQMYKLFTWAPMETMGCAYAFCDELLDTYSGRTLTDTYYWKCNYFPVGDLDEAPYTAGTPCTDCPDGTGWCNNELDMCDDSCSPSDASCDCLYSDTCTGNYDFDPNACSCTCNHPECETNPFECILKCGDPMWKVFDPDTRDCRCDCPPGYTTSTAQDACHDIDECEDLIVCDHFCDNTPGSYVCSCMFGFVLDTDGRSCVPFFQIGRHDFVPSTTEGVVTHEETTYVTPEITREVTTDEPTTEEATTRCLVHDCGDHGSYNALGCVCDCDDGFAFDVVSEFDSTLTCVDIDECVTMDTGCEICENLVGTYHCVSCPPGYALEPLTELCVEDVCDLGLGMFCSGNGFLDEAECECFCYAGYDGTACADVCDATKSRCWPEYETELPTSASQCVVECPECECTGYPGCANNGLLARAPGFQHLSRGICYCYCPLPWSGELCDECNLECGNGGVLNGADCRCMCPDGWYGVECNEPCVETSRLCTTRTASLCGDVAIIDQQCPIMCSLCIAEE